MKASKTVLVLLIAASILVGFTVAQQLVSRTLTTSLTISAVGELVFYSNGGTPVTSLSFGTLAPGQHWVKTVNVSNEGNSPLYLTAQRNDNATAILSALKNPDDTDFQGMTPKLLGIGEQITVKIEVWSTEDAPAGSYSPEFLFVGSDS